MSTQQIAPPREPPLADTALEAVRAAIVAFAPLRLPELEREKDQAFAEALKCNSLGPVDVFLQRWRIVADLAEDLALAARFHSTARSRQDADARRAAALEIAAVLLTAAAKVEPG